MKELERRIKELEDRPTFVDLRSKKEIDTCLWNSMPETFPGSGIKVGALVCPCPKCSPRC